MNKHDHDVHRCECSHDRVKYCKKCQLVHCLDCGFEWSRTPYYYYPYYQPNWTGWGYTGIQGSSSGTGQFTGQTVTYTNTTGCNHGD